MRSEMCELSENHLNRSSCGVFFLFCVGPPRQPGDRSRREPRHVVTPASKTFAGTPTCGGWLLDALEKRGKVRMWVCQEMRAGGEQQRPIARERTRAR